MINFVITGTEETRSRLAETREAFTINLSDAIKKSLVKLQERVKTKLSGEVLKNRTGRLRRSVHAEDVKIEDGALVGTLIAGTNVEYAAIHEYGFDGSEKVKEHLRKITQAFGREMSEPKAILIRAHTRHMVMPERSFLRSSLRELEGDIKNRIENAIKETLST